MGGGGGWWGGGGGGVGGVGGWGVGGVVGWVVGGWGGVGGGGGGGGEGGGWGCGVWGQLLLDLQTRWDTLEKGFGLSIGLREFAYICSKDSNLSASVRTFLSATLPAAAIGHVTVLAAVTSLLWPRADEVRQRALQSYNPYRQGRKHGSRGGAPSASESIDRNDRTL